MAVTAGGTPYVESSDLVANYPGVSLALANHIDTIGKVLQVVTFKSGAINVTTTSSSFVTTGVTISITPQFSDSKILLAFTGHFGQDTGNQAVSVALFRGTVAGTNLGVIGGLQSSAGSVRSMLTQVMFDEPATTAAVTYTLGFVSEGGATARAGIGTIMAMLAIEVAA